MVPVISGAPYSLGDQLGGIEKLSDVVPTEEKDQSIIDVMTVVDKAKQNACMEFLFFDTDPTATISSTDNTPFTITDAGSDLVIQAQRMLSIRYFDLGASSIASLKTRLPFKALPGSRDLWMAVIVRATPTYSIGDLTYKLSIDQS